MKPLTVIRAIVAWVISPFVFFFLVPLFMLLDFLHDVDGTTSDLIDSWKSWAFMRGDL